MDDEISSADELFRAAELREVVMHQLVANREPGPDPEALGVPPEKLHAPGSADDSAAAEFCTSVGGRELGLRIAVTTRNAYAAFHVDVEAVFALPTPIATGSQAIVQAFMEQVGGPAVFPYIRTAVASLAAQLSVPASPLPLLNSVEMELAADVSAPDDDDHLPLHPEHGDEDRFVHGQVAVQTAVIIDGLGTATRTDEVADFLIDTRTQQLVQMGGEGTIAVDQIDFIAKVLQIDPAVFWPDLRQEGDSAAEASDVAGLDGDPSKPIVPEGFLMTGTMTKTADDGTVEVLGEFFIDAETGALIRMGGEGLTPDADELLDSWAELASDGPWVELAKADELTWQSVIRDHGVDAARQSIEDIRSREGDAVADAALDRMESALRQNAIEDAVLALNDAMNQLAAEAIATKEFGDDLPAALVAAIERAVARWDDFKEV